MNSSLDYSRGCDTKGAHVFTWSQQELPEKEERLDMTDSRSLSTRPSVSMVWITLSIQQQILSSDYLSTNLLSSARGYQYAHGSETTAGNGKERKRKDWVSSHANHYLYHMHMPLKSPQFPHQLN